MTDGFFVHFYIFGIITPSGLIRKCRVTVETKGKGQESTEEDKSSYTKAIYWKVNVPSQQFMSGCELSTPLRISSTENWFHSSRINQPATILIINCLVLMAVCEDLLLLFPA